MLRMMVLKMDPRVIESKRKEQISKIRENLVKLKQGDRKIHGRNDWNHSSILKR